MYWTCGIHPHIIWHMSTIWNKHTYKHKQLSFYLWALPAALLRCIRLSALQIRDRLLRVKCHVCTDQIPGLGGNGRDGEGDGRRKRRRNMVHLLVNRVSDPVTSIHLTAILFFRCSRLHGWEYRKGTAKSCFHLWIYHRCNLQWKRAKSSEVSGWGSKERKCEYRGEK